MNDRSDPSHAFWWQLPRALSVGELPVPSSFALKQTPNCQRDAIYWGAGTG